MQTLSPTTDEFFDGQIVMADTDKAAAKLGIPVWGRVLIKWLWRISVGFALALLAMFWQLVSLNRSIGALEGSVHQMPASIAKQLLGQTKQAMDSGNLNEAQESFRIAATLLETAKEQRIPLPDKYFRDVASQLEQLGKARAISSDVHAVRVHLAEYHSELQPIPKVHGPEKAVNAPIEPSNAFMIGRTVLNKTAPGDFFVMKSTVQSLDRNITVDGPVLRGAVPGVSQTLDGVHWINVVFVNVHIKYEGREVELRNVQFVNCTFEIVDNNRGSQVVNYALLRTPESLTLDSKTSPV